MKALFAWVLRGLFCLLLVACSREPLHTQESFVFGTRVELQIYGASEHQAREAADKVLREFDRLHGAFHAWQPSQLTALNGAIARGERDIAVSEELFSLLQGAQTIAAQSHDLFNPAMGSLIALWGFHADTYAPRLPAQEAIAQALAKQPRMADLVLEHKRVTSRNPAVQLDFGGYAKGYALDRAAEILRDSGIEHALINIGGNVIALGTKGRQPWRVGIADPRGTGAIGTVALADGEAIGTSGDYQRYFEVEGQRYCHVLDGRVGTPARGARAVTVLMPKGPQAGVLSDALSKPLFIVAPHEWPGLAESLSVTQALRVHADGAIDTTPALKARLTLAQGVSLAPPSSPGSGAR
ncbi:MAG: hypothetical protein RIR70_2121 [Pseudomonadota bacterium]